MTEAPAAAAPLTLEAFADRYFPGPRVPAKDGFAVRCPGCSSLYTLTLSLVRDLPEPFVSVICSTEDCPGNGEWHTRHGLTEEEWDAAVTAVWTVADPTGGPAKPEKDEKGSRFSANDVVEYVLANYRVGRSTDGLLFAVPNFPGAPRIARDIRSIRSDVTRRFREDRIRETGTGAVIGRDTLSSALEVVAAYAEEAPEESVYLRSAQIRDGLVLDLGDPEGHLVKVTAAGWAVVKSSDDDRLPLFRRSEAIRPLPVPTRGGEISVLRDLLDLKEEDPRWLLARGWLTSALFEGIPRPLLWAVGPQGSGKSTRARMLLSLLEPVGALGKEPGRNERDDYTAARGRFLVSYDNITSVSRSTSDWICRLVTGVADDRRALYTDDDLRSVEIRRSGVATSIILPPGLGADALERLVILRLDRVPDDERRGEAALWSAYEAARPALLGAVLDDVVTALRNLPDVAEERRSWPRMADYGQILLALDRGLGIADEEGHLAAYESGVNASLSERAKDDPFSSAVLALVEKAGGEWRGSLGALCDLLGYDGGIRHEERPKWWPRTPRAVGFQLDVNSESLRHAGLTWRRVKVQGAREVILTLDTSTSD